MFKFICDKCKKEWEYTEDLAFHNKYVDEHGERQQASGGFCFDCFSKYEKAVERLKEKHSDELGKLDEKWLELKQ